MGNLYHRATKKSSSGFFRRWLIRFANQYFSSYERLWDFYARNPRSANAAVADVEDEATIDARGKEEAALLASVFKPTDTILDLGCGIGRIEKHLAPHVQKIVAMDVSQRMLKHAQHRVPAKNIEWVKGNGRDLAFLDDASLDGAFSFYVFQHLKREDTIRYLAELHRVLKPGETLVAEFPNLAFPEHTATYIDYVKTAPVYSLSRMRWYTTQELETLFSALDFSVKEIRGGTDRHLIVIAKKS